MKVLIFCLIVLLFVSAGFAQELRESIRPYNDPKLDRVWIGMPVWVNHGDNLCAYGSRFPKLDRKCFGLSAEAWTADYGKAWITGIEYHDPVGRKVNSWDDPKINRHKHYRATWINKDGTTSDRLFYATDLFKMINVRDERSEWSEVIALLNW